MQATALGWSKHRAVPVLDGLKRRPQVRFAATGVGLNPTYPGYMTGACAKAVTMHYRVGLSRLGVVPTRVVGS